MPGELSTLFDEALAVFAHTVDNTAAGEIESLLTDLRVATAQEASQRQASRPVASSTPHDLSNEPPGSH